MDQTQIPYLIPIATFLICCLLWMLKGRDAPGRKTVIPEYQPPSGLSPAEVGLLEDFKATDREITATLVDLAIRGYINIHTIPKKSIFGSHTAYEFELINDNVLNLKRHEKALINGLFGVVSVKQIAKMITNQKDPSVKQRLTRLYPAQKPMVGKRVALGDLEPYFYQYVLDAKGHLYSDLNLMGYFKSFPLSAGTNLVLVGVVLLFISIFLSPPYRYSLIASALILVIFSPLMAARTQAGKLTKEAIDGFKLYLKTAESDRLKVLQSPKGSEVTGSKVKLYESYLPYAIALGLEADWSKNFKSVYSQPPRWFERPIEDIVELVSSIHAGFVANK